MKFENVLEIQKRVTIEQDIYRNYKRDKLKHPLTISGYILALIVGFASSSIILSMEKPWQPQKVLSSSLQLQSQGKVGKTIFYSFHLFTLIATSGLYWYLVNQLIAIDTQSLQNEESKLLSFINRIDLEELDYNEKIFLAHVLHQTVPHATTGQNVRLLLDMVD